MPNRIILLNNKPIIARFVGDKIVYGHYGSFWIRRKAIQATYSAYSQELGLTLDKELPGTSAIVGAITIEGKTFRPLTSFYSNESDESAYVKTRFDKHLRVFVSRYNSEFYNMGSFYKYDIPVLMRLDSVVRMIGLTIQPYVAGKFTTKDGQDLPGSKGMWCNGEIIMFKSIQLLYGTTYIVTVQQDYLTAYNNVLSRGNLTNMKCFLILDETRV